MPDPDIWLLSTERQLSDFKNLPEPDCIFFVSNGAWPLRGIRFNNVYVDYMCYRNPNYEECMGMLFSSRGLMENFGSFFLI